MRKEPINIENLDSIIPIGQKIEVYVPEGNFKGTYSSFIYDMDDEYIYILMPTDKSGLKAIVRRKDIIYVSFVDERDRRIGFSVNIVDILDKDGKVLYKVNKPTKEAYSIEFRENFRVDILTDAKITYINGSSISKTTGTVIDISASGAKLSVGVSLEDSLEIGKAVFISFTLNNIKLENIEAKIVRKAVSRGDKANHYGLKFVNLDKKTEESIIKFCINRQLEFARKMRGL